MPRFPALPWKYTIFCFQCKPKMQYVAVAQLDRVSDSDSEGRRFESCQPYHVAADAISFAATIFLTEQSSLLTHSVAAPFQSRSPVLRDCYFKTGRKVRFATALSISRGIESTVRPLPCSSFSNRSRRTGFGLVFGTGLRTPYRSRRRFFLQNNRRLLFTFSQLLSSPDPLTLGSGFVLYRDSHGLSPWLSLYKTKKPVGSSRRLFY